MTEFDEIALEISDTIGLFAVCEIYNLHDAKEIVKEHLKDESETILDNVSESLLNVAKACRE